MTVTQVILVIVLGTSERQNDSYRYDNHKVSVYCQSLRFYLFMFSFERYKGNNCVYHKKDSNTHL